MANDELSPGVSIVISAYNEAEVILDKLQNVADLNFPKERLECIVISDCSDDGTDEIVKGFDATDVRLARMPERRGKSAGLTRFVPECKHNFVVFTDANAMFRPDAIQYLVKHFRDPTVGYVVGQQKYLESEGDQVSESEGFYWKYETLLKRWESRVDSVVGGDGAIYAIRRSLFKPLRDDDINDFINPLQIIQLGYRGVYEPDAVCVERVAGSFGGEYRRKVRIANRSFRAFVREWPAANPFRTGLFAFHLISHKVLRWFTAFLILVAWLLASASAVTGNSWIAIALCGGQTAFCSLAALGAIQRLRALRLFSIPFYFCLGNLAAAHGILHYCVGRKHATWKPDREQSVQMQKTSRGRSFRWLLPLLLMIAIAASLLFPQATLAVCCVSLVSSHIAFPLVLKANAKLNERQLSSQAVESNTDPKLPMLSVIIPARNEEVCIEKKIQNSLKLNYPSDCIEVVVVDDASEDRTAEIASEFGKCIKFIGLPNRGGKATALKVGFNASIGSVLLLTDANVNVDADAAKHLVAGLKDPLVACTVADVRLKSPNELLRCEGDYQTFEFQVLTWESAWKSAVCVDGGLYAIRRESFIPPAFDCILDDFSISAAALNQGRTIQTVAMARAFENSCTRVSDEFRRRERLGRGVVQCLQRGTHPMPHTGFPFIAFVFHKLARWATPFLLLTALLAIVAISISTPYWLASGSVLFVAVNVMPWILPEYWIRQFAFGRLLAFGHVVMLGMGWGILMELLGHTTSSWNPATRSGFGDPQASSEMQH
ncbi:glycosyltransferase [Rhodopirellula sallentina]|uniref:glycosyltransferase n=1 Tax=Rhodopirellula sallentina TaxID=1263869 RepID=UPI001360B5D7|nr:glycosyltransferase [Rhodopirellula sallentina]